jgi:hypothetical protein
MATPAKSSVQRRNPLLNMRIADGDGTQYDAWLSELRSDSEDTPSYIDPDVRTVLNAICHSVASGVIIDDLAKQYGLDDISFDDFDVTIASAEAIRDFHTKHMAVFHAKVKATYERNRDHEAIQAVSTWKAQQPGPHAS